VNLNLKLVDRGSKRFSVDREDSKILKTKKSENPASRKTKVRRTKTLIQKTATQVTVKSLSLKKTKPWTPGRTSKSRGGNVPHF
jgi:hypothetical protein